MCEKQEKHKKGELNFIAFNFEIFSQRSFYQKHSNDSFVHLGDQIVSLVLDGIYQTQL